LLLGVPHRAIDAVWTVQSAHSPLIDDMEALIAVDGLARDWKQRLTERVRWIRERRRTA